MTNLHPHLLQALAETRQRELLDAAHDYKTASMARAARKAERRARRTARRAAVNSSTSDTPSPAIVSRKGAEAGMAQALAGPTAHIGCHAGDVTRELAAQLAHSKMCVPVSRQRAARLLQVAPSVSGESLYQHWSLRGPCSAPDKARQRIVR
jgi:hypothetical protein